MEVLERRIAKTTKSAMGNKALAKELETLKKLYAHLEDGKWQKALSRRMRMNSRSSIRWIS